MNSSIRLHLKPKQEVIAVLGGMNEGHQYKPGDIGVVHKSDNDEPPIVIIGGLINLGCVDLRNWNRYLPCFECKRKFAEEAEMSGCCHKMRCKDCHVKHQPCKYWETRRRVRAENAEARAPAHVFDNLEDVMDHLEKSR